MFKEPLNEFLVGSYLILLIFIAGFIINSENMLQSTEVVLIYGFLFLIAFFIDNCFEKILKKNKKEKMLKNKEEEKQLKNRELTVTLHKDFREKEVNN